MNRSHLLGTANVMARRASARRAMTLYELIAVVFIIGIVSAMAVTRYSTTTLADIGATGFARRVSLETATRGTMIAAMIPRIVTTANNSISEKPLRLFLLRVI